MPRKPFAVFSGGANLPDGVFPPVRKARKAAAAPAAPPPAAPVLTGSNPLHWLISKAAALATAQAADAVLVFLLTEAAALAGAPGATAPAAPKCGGVAAEVPQVRRRFITATPPDELEAALEASILEVREVRQ